MQYEWFFIRLMQTARIEMKMPENGFKALIWNEWHFLYEMARNTLFFHSGPHSAEMRRDGAANVVPSPCILGTPS